MISKVCDLCGSVEAIDKGKSTFYTFTRTYGRLIPTTETIHMCQKCYDLIKEMRKKQGGGAE